MVEAQKVVSNIAVTLIKIYQYLLSPLFGPCCRFTPSCSQYTLVAIQRHGLFTGTLLAFKRISKCHPWHPGGVDQVPESITIFHKAQADD